MSTREANAELLLQLAAQIINASHVLAVIADSEKHFKDEQRAARKIQAEAQQVFVAVDDLLDMLTDEQRAEIMQLCTPQSVDGGHA